MSPTNGEDRLSVTVARVMGVASTTVSDASSPDTVATWDSLTHLSLMLAIEQEFGVSIAPEKIVEMRSVGQVRMVLRGLGVEV